MELRNIEHKIFMDYVCEDLDITYGLIRRKNDAKILDLGCGDGHLTVKFSKKIGSKNLFGIDFFPEAIKKARDRGINCCRSDLNKKFPFGDNEFDVLISHFSLEHLVNIRGFVKECYRVLKPGGYMLVTSDNLNSWLNIFAMILTFQPFSSTLGLSDKPAGNPFSFWTDQETKIWNEREDKSIEGAGSHIRVLSTRAAKEVFINHGFKIKALRGAGYFPFWGSLSKFFARIDPYHAHFFIIKAVK